MPILNCRERRLSFSPLVTKPETKTGLRIQGHRSLGKPISIPELINAIEENLRAQ